MKVPFLDAASMSVPLVFPDEADIDYRPYPSSVADEVIERCADAPVVITNKVPLSAEALAALPRLERVCVAATGVDCVDARAAERHGIQVLNVKGYSTDSVAEHVIAMVMQLLRGTHDSARAAIDGRWSDSAVFAVHGQPIAELAELTLGIVGRGMIGEAVGQRAAALGMTVRYASASGRAPSGDDECTLDALFEQSDLISLHCPLVPGTRAMIDADRLSRMKRGAWLINTARGPLIDDAALVSALRDGQLAGAAIDVLDREPPPADHPLLQTDVPNLIVTPHVAWASRRAQRRLAEAVVANVLKGL